MQLHNPMQPAGIDPISAAMQPSSVAKPVSPVLDKERRIAWDEEAYTENQFQEWYRDRYLPLWQCRSTVEVSSVAKPAGINPISVAM